jgi:hypothetical protein
MMEKWEYKVWSRENSTFLAVGEENSKSTAISMIWNYIKIRSGIKKINPQKTLLDFLEEIAHNIPEDLMISVSLNGEKITELKFNDVIAQCIINVSVGNHEELLTYISKLVGKDE